jgi:hypothetical protein
LELSFKIGIQILKFGLDFYIAWSFWQRGHVLWTLITASIFVIRFDAYAIANIVYFILGKGKPWSEICTNLPFFDILW